MQLTPDEIKIRITKSLPGFVSHLKMAPPTRKAELEAAKEAMQFAKKSAVMILLFHEDEKLKVVFIRRSFYVGIHAGQMAFPGGRFEDSDVTVKETAFREIEEEIGITRDKIELLGRISDIYVPPSNFLISVFVGYLSEKPVYKPDDREVAEIIEVDFDEFLKPENKAVKSFHVPSANHSVTAPCYQTHQCDIWGASAMVMSELVDILTLKRICAITMARNDSFFLERWIDYYGSQLGKENLYILLDGFDQQIPTNAGTATIKHCEHIDAQVAAADKGRIALLTELAADLLKTYDLVIGTDADEFLAVDPNCSVSLHQYLSSITIKTTVSGLGLDVGQHLDLEMKLNKNQPFLQQRQFALVSSRYTKAVVISKPIQWGSGFHRVRNHNFKIDKNLYLFHFGCVDYQMLTDRFSDADRMKNGWERHLNKRAKTISIITKSKALRAETFLPFARVFQTIFRPVFAWNKPTMAGCKWVVIIPERFTKPPLC